MAGVRNSLPAFTAHRAVPTASRDRWRATGCHTGLIDTRLVRAELSRLRGPRPEIEPSKKREPSPAASART
jgi:hypothetical protein